ncbi:MAG: hypothetical protein ACTSXH_03075 [Promethearchaeota archaeon]
MRIYITHCSAKKNEKLKNTNLEVTPDILYLATPIQRFIRKCKEKGVNWAIFSDLYGVWFPEEKYCYYDKHPNKVTEKEYNYLLENFTKKLQQYDEIWFYYNPGRFHSLYKRLLQETPLKEKIIFFTHIKDIK